MPPDLSTRHSARGVHQLPQLLLKLVEVSGRILVDNDQIDFQSVQMPEFVCQQQLAQQTAMVRLQTRSSTIGSSPEMPCRQSVVCPCRLAENDSAARKMSRKEQRRNEPLIQLKLVGERCKMPQLDLAVSPGQLKSALHNARVAILIGKLQRLFAAFGKSGDERQAGRFVGQDRERAQAEDRVENRAGRARRAAYRRIHRGWSLRRPPAARKRARSVSYSTYSIAGGSAASTWTAQAVATRPRGDDVAKRA